MRELSHRGSPENRSKQAGQKVTKYHTNYQLNEKKLSAPPTVLEAMVICESVVCSITELQEMCKSSHDSVGARPKKK